MQETQSIHDVLEQFCGLVEDEADRQETVLAVCRAHQEAALSNDIPQLEAKTAALSAIVRDVAQAEKERSRLLTILADYYSLPANHRNIARLAPMTPEPWASRLLEAQHRLRLATKSSRGFVRSTGRTLRWSLRAVNSCMKALGTAMSGSNHVYGSAGAFDASSGQRPALMDQKG